MRRISLQLPLVLLCFAATLIACGKAKQPAAEAVAKAQEAAEMAKEAVAKAGEAALASVDEAKETAEQAQVQAQAIADNAKHETAKRASEAAAIAEAAAREVRIAADNTKLDLSGALLDPSKATLAAPANFTAKFTTTKGEFSIAVRRDWAPKGADRFYNLVKVGYFTDVAFFRVIDGFMAQFGIHGDPKVNAAWRLARIADDPVTQTNSRGMVTFATGGPNTRTTQLFINFANNGNLDSMGFSPFGSIDAEGMKLIDIIYSGYGEGQPSGKGPLQGQLQAQGNAYLKAEFPMMDYIKKVEIVP
jgi:peptidyl-prolyl cis-trans isomerase A (cyclophilin A)